MKTTRKSTMFLVRGGLIAAIYAALTAVSALLGLAYGNIQFRFSEALTILPVFTPAAIPGLTLGCFLGNLGSPYGLVDILCGTAASLIAAILTRLASSVRAAGIPVLAPLPPVLVNAVIVGAEIAVFLPEGFTAAGFFISALQVGLGQLVVCYGLGIPLFLAIRRTGRAETMFGEPAGGRPR